MNVLHAGVESLICRQLTAGQSDGNEAIHTRRSKRGGLFRVELPAGGSVVVKTWRARNLKERFKVFAGISNARHEWRMQRMLFRAGVDVPEPQAFRRLRTQKGQAWEVMVIEDLGDTERALPWLKHLVHEGRETDVQAFEDRLIQETLRFVNLRVLDIDHQLNNFVVNSSGRLMRVDFECARRYPLGIMPQRRYARMLARFITGHIHAVQPDVGRSVRFTQRLYATLGTSARMRRLVQQYVDGNLVQQLDRSGIATAVTLPG